MGAPTALVLGETNFDLARVAPENGHRKARKKDGVFGGATTCAGFCVPVIATRSATSSIPIQRKSG